VDAGVKRRGGRDATGSRMDWLLSAYEEMRRIRSFEDAVARLFAEGKLPGFVHLSTGQEAVAVGACRALEPSDWITSTHRGHGHCIAKGLPLKPMMAEVFGKATGACRGQGGSMHIADIDRGILGANGVVGAGLPIAAGAALAEDFRAEGRIVMAFFGDGAAGTGAFHEAVNLAATWRLPVVFVCENNQYAEFTRFSDMTPVPSVAERIAAYGIADHRADGNDVEDVFQACHQAVDSTRAGRGPCLVEAHTYRVRGHYEGDPMKYRDPAERGEASESDPLLIAARRLGDLGIPAPRIEEVQRVVEGEVTEAIAFSEQSEQADPAGYRETVYAGFPSVEPGVPSSAAETGRYMDAVATAIAEEMERDDRVFVMGVDVYAGGGVYGVTRPLARFGQHRIRDAPISETAILGAGVGAALAGYRPIVEIMFMDFLAVCFDQLVNQAAKLRFMSGGRCSVPLVVRTQTGAGRSAGPQHSQSWEALLAHVPGLAVVMPATPRDAGGLMRAAIRADSPVVFVENRLLYGVRGELGPKEEVLEIGRATVARPGSDATVVSWSRMLHEVLEAADQLASEGISLEVVDLRTIQPLDVATILESVGRTNRLLVVHEAVADFGAGAEIAARVQEDAFGLLDAPVARLGSPFSPTPFAPSQEAVHIPSATAIRDRVVELVQY
jgi:2-oxoisovalerate dehydrogenase E1 component